MSTRLSSLMMPHQQHSSPHRHHQQQQTRHPQAQQHYNHQINRQSSPQQPLSSPPPPPARFPINSTTATDLNNSRSLQYSGANTPTENAVRLEVLKHIIQQTRAAQQQQSQNSLSNSSRHPDNSTSNQQQPQRYHNSTAQHPQQRQPQQESYSRVMPEFDGARARSNSHHSHPSSLRQNNNHNNENRHQVNSTNNHNRHHHHINGPINDVRDPESLTITVDNEVISLTEDGLSALRVPVIKSITQALGLKQTGKKAVLVDRILTYAESDEGYAYIASGLHISYEEPIRGRRRVGPPSSVNDHNHSLPHQSQQQNGAIRSTGSTMTTARNAPSSSTSSNSLSFPFDPHRPQHLPAIANCLCRGAPKSLPGPLIECVKCNMRLHALCMRWERNVAEINKVDFICPRCRLVALDPFFPVVDTLWTAYLHPGLDSVNLMETPEGDNMIVMKEGHHISADALHYWRRQGKEVVVRCVTLGTPSNDHMQLQHDWPRTIDIRVKDNVESIYAPRPDHKRRDTPLIITHFLKPERNDVEVLSSGLFDEKGDTTAYLLGVFLCDSLDANQLMNQIQERCRSDTFMVGRERVRQLMKANTVDDDELECVERNQKFKLTCPITLMRMTLPARGRDCRHLQCFDLESFIQVTKGSKAFNNRWKCPECPLILRSDMIVVDPFVLEMLRIAPENVDVVEVATDGSYSLVTPSNEMLGEASSDEEEDVDPSKMTTQPTGSNSMGGGTVTNPWGITGPISVEDIDSDDDDVPLAPTQIQSPPQQREARFAFSSIQQTQRDIDDERQSKLQCVSLTSSSSSSPHGDRGQKRRRLSSGSYDERDSRHFSSIPGVPSDRRTSDNIGNDRSVQRRSVDPPTINLRHSPAELIDLSPSTCSSTAATEPEDAANDCEERQRKRRRTSSNGRWDDECGDRSNRKREDDDDHDRDNNNQGGGGRHNSTSSSNQQPYHYTNSNNNSHTSSGHTSGGGRGDTRYGYRSISSLDSIQSHTSHVSPPSPFRFRRPQHDGGHVDRAASHTQNDQNDQSRLPYQSRMVVDSHGPPSSNTTSTPYRSSPIPIPPQLPTSSTDDTQRTNSDVVASRPQSNVSADAELQSSDLMNFSNALTDLLQSGPSQVQNALPNPTHQPESTSDQSIIDSTNSDLKQLLDLVLQSSSHLSSLPSTQASSPSPSINTPNTIIPNNHTPPGNPHGNPLPNSPSLSVGSHISTSCAFVPPAAPVAISTIPTRDNRMSPIATFPRPIPLPDNPRSSPSHSSTQTMKRFSGCRFVPIDPPPSSRLPQPSSPLGAPAPSHTIQIPLLRPPSFPRRDASGFELLPSPPRPSDDANRAFTHAQAFLTPPSSPRYQQPLPVSLPLLSLPSTKPQHKPSQQKQQSAASQRRDHIRKPPKFAPLPLPTASTSSLSDSPSHTAISPSITESVSTQSDDNTTELEKESLKAAASVLSLLESARDGLGEELTRLLLDSYDTFSTNCGSFESSEDCEGGALSTTASSFDLSTPQTQSPCSILSPPKKPSPEKSFHAQLDKNKSLSTDSGWLPIDVPTRHYDESKEDDQQPLLTPLPSSTQSLLQDEFLIDLFNKSARPMAAG